MFEKKHANALPLPPLATTKLQAQEILRMWVCPGFPSQVAIRAHFSDPGVWGTLIADLFRHVSQTYVNEGADRDQVLQRIRTVFDSQWAMTPEPVPPSPLIELGN